MFSILEGSDQSHLRFASSFFIVFGETQVKQQS